MVEWLVQWFLLPLLGLGVWACGSAFVAAYVERYVHQKGHTSYDWFDDAPGILLVILWPITVPLVAPFYGAHKLGSVVFNRLHRAELIQDELAGKNSGTTTSGQVLPVNGTAYINFMNGGLVNQTVTIPIQNSYGNIRFNTPITCESVDVAVS